MKYVLMLLACFYVLEAGAPLGVVEHQGEKVPLDLTFIDETGKKVTLGELMDGKPTILTLNYYRCSGICTPQLDELAKVLGRMDLKEVRDYTVLTVSFAENESHELAYNKKKNMLTAIGRPFDPKGWRFVVTDGNSSAELAKRVGFRYEKTVSPAGVVDYIHPASLIMLSPEGKITRYLNGVEQLPFDVKMALIEASQGRVGPTIAKTLLFCFAYDPKGRTYVFLWEKILGIVLTLLLIGFFIYLVRSSKKTQPQVNSTKGENE